MDLSSVFAVLQQADKQAQETNPYLGFSNIGDQLGNLVVKSAGQSGADGAPRYGMGELSVAGLLSGLLSGGAGVAARDYQAEQNQLAQDTLFKLWTDGSIERPKNMNPSVFSSISNAGKMIGVQRKLDQSDDKRKGDLQLRNSFMNSLAGAKSPYEREQAIKTGKAMGILPEDFQMGGGEARPMVAQPDAQPSGMFPGGPPSLQSEFNKTFQAYQQMGATPNAAVDAASQLTSAKRKALTGSVDQVKEARDVANSFDAIAQTAEAGVQGAGNTGGLGWGLKNLASSAYALVSPEEAQQRASQSLLDSIKPDIVKAVRTKGVGAMSDVEMQQYIGAGPSSSNTPEQNAILIEKFKNVASLQRQYADFLDTYREEKGTVQGAEKYWQAYKEANPLFVKDQSGQLVFNSERQNWQEFFTGGGAQSAATPRAMTQQGGGVIIKRTLKDGRTVNVRSLGDGTYEVVE